MAAYRKGVAKGMLKVMAKMGISTLQSYKGAQIFEGLGLGEEVIESLLRRHREPRRRCRFRRAREEARRRHALGYPESFGDQSPALPNPGEFHWRSTGERHAWDPDSIHELQLAARNDDATPTAFCRIGQR